MDKGRMSNHVYSSLTPLFLLNISQSFITLCEASHGFLANKSSKMDIRDFETGCKKCDIRIRHHDIKTIFNYIDVNKDGLIDFDDWKK